jgi:hypothetical protein
MLASAIVLVHQLNNNILQYACKEYKVRLTM